MVKKIKKEVKKKTHSEDFSLHHHKKHRKDHRTFRTFYFIFVVIPFAIIFFSFPDTTVGLFIGYMFCLASFVIYELIISKYIKNHDLKVNCLHQAYIGLVALVAAFLTYATSVFLKLGLEDSLLLMTVLTVTILLLTINHIDDYIEKII